jgi:transposase
VPHSRQLPIEDIAARPCFIEKSKHLTIWIQFFYQINYATSYTVPEAAKSLGIASNILYRWKDKITSDLEGKSLSTDEREELIRLRKENKNLRMEKEILKKASVGMPHHFFAKEMK